MIARDRGRWILASAGCWCAAAVAELAGQWTLLSPPPVSFFGQPVTALIVAVYACCGLVWALPLTSVPSGAVRWVALLAPPLLLGTAGLLFPEGGLVGVSGVALVAGVLLGVALASRALRHRTPSPAMGLPVIVAGIPLVLSMTARPTARAASVETSPRPNLLLVTIDTLRPDHLGLMGYRRATSPGLDSLATEGRLFSHAYAPAPSTSPSHASILTGVYPAAHGVRRNGWPLGREVTTLGEVLSAAGYQTGAVVSVAHLAGGFGWDRGFSWFHDQGQLDGLFPYSGVRVIRMALRIIPLEFSCRAEISVGRALAWLGTIDEPFFLWLHLWDPHDPYAPPAPYDAMFRGHVPVPKSSGYDEPRIAEWVNGYDGEIRYVDDQLGRVWQHLRRRGLSDHTVVVVLSDHGESLGERSYQGHSILLYDEQVRVLFLIAGPGIQPAQVSTPVSLVDVMPTVLATLGVSSIGTLDGRQLISQDLPAVPVWLDVDMWGFRGRGVRMGSWKLATYDRLNPSHRGFAPNPSPLLFLAGTELYDLEGDPTEVQNQARERPDRVALLRELFREGGRQGESPVLPPAMERALRSLGYVD